MISEYPLPPSYEAYLPWTQGLYVLFASHTRHGNELGTVAEIGRPSSNLAHYYHTATAVGAVLRHVALPRAFEVFQEWKPNVLITFVDGHYQGDDFEGAISLIRAIRHLPAKESGKIPAIFVTRAGRLFPISRQLREAGYQEIVPYKPGSQEHFVWLKEHFVRLLAYFGGREDPDLERYLADDSLWRY